MSSDSISPGLGPLVERMSISGSVDAGGVDKTHAERMAALFQDEHSKVVHYLVARAGSWAEARDIAAQAFSQVLMMKDPNSVGSLRAYVYRAAHNIATDRQKQGAIRRRIDVLAHQEMSTVSPSPEPELMEQERLDILNAAVERLRPVHRMAVALRFWDRLSYDEIVQRFADKGMSVNERTVRRWIVDAMTECRRAVRTAEGEVRS
jgi:RNA polymerase sigma factor (sigma-70 family)